MSMSPETHRGRTTTVGMIGEVSKHQARGSMIISNGNFFGWKNRDGLSMDGSSVGSSRDGSGFERVGRERFETDLESLQEEEESSTDSDSNGPEAI